MEIYKFVAIFDTSEFISFLIAFLGLLIIACSYFVKQRKSALSGKSSVKLMLIIFLLMFLNRFFTNIEALAYKDFLNLLEHLSSLIAGFTAVAFSWKVAKK